MMECHSPYPTSFEFFDVWVDQMRWTLFLNPSGGSAPVAAFSGTPTIGAPPLAVSFTDSSTNSPTAWSWTFGDGGSSTAQNPSHTYTSVNSYTIALTAYNQYGNNTCTKTNYINVGNAPVANFSGTPTIGAPPLAVAFTDSSTNSPTSWSWTFGDGGSSTAQNPSHTYTTTGLFTVALTATNQYGNNTCTKSNYINVGNAPVANFSGTPTSGNAPLSVTFTDSSTNSPTSWSWTFGDQNTSTVQNPSHAYTGAGTYTVALTATNQYGNNTCTKNNYITVTAGPPVAAFTATPPTGGPAPLTVNFTDQSTNTPTSWSWTFGDGGTSTAQNPSHTYTTVGVYTVALKATNSAGNNTATYPGFVETRTSTSGELSEAPSIYGVGAGTLLSGSLSDVATENSVYMVVQCNTSQQVEVGYYFTGQPTNASAVHVELRSHCSRNDTPNLAFQAYNPSTGTYTVMRASTLFSTSDQWVTYDTTNASTIIDSSGTTLLRICGCPVNGNNYTLSLDVVRLVLTFAPPVANFSGTPTIGAPPLAVSFTDSSTNSPTAWSWTFGDGGSSTAQNPSHTYTTTGLFTVALTAYNQYGNNTCTKTNYISVGNPPVANFSGTPTIGAPPLAVTFTDSSTNSPTSWSWTFGDGGSSTAQNPSHTYTTTGLFTVALTAYNQYGHNTCTKTNYITVGNPPVASFSGTPTTGNKPLSVTFTDSSTNSPTSWSWTFGDGGTSTAQNPSHQYTGAGKYTVALTATNQYGHNTCTKTNYIIVSGDFTASSATLDSGTQSQGSYTSTQVADGTYWMITAVKVGNYYQDQETYTMNTGMSSLSSIIISVKDKVNTGTQTEKVYLYNNSTSAWDLENTVTLNSTNTLNTKTVSSAASYMSSGTVKVRVYVGGTGGTLYLHSTDYVSINCTP